MSKLLRYTLLTGAGLYLAVYIILALFRMQYPFELEWMEGASLIEVSRILSARQLYVSPSLEFVPLIYTPLYFYLSAALSSIMGLEFLPLRFVSFVASLACFFVIFLIVKAETGSPFSGTVSAGLFAATFRISGSWFDIARVDSVFLCFLLITLYLIMFKASSRSLVLAGVFISLAFLTKQTALLVSLPLMLYSVLFNWRRAIFFIASILMIIGTSTLLLNYLHDGWYNYYVFELPRNHSIAKEMFVNFWTKDLIAPLSIACVMSIFYIITQLSNAERKSFWFFSSTAMGMVGASWAARLNLGSYDNVLFPAYAAISVLFGLALHQILNFIRVLSADKRTMIEIFVWLLCISQFASLIYNPVSQVPTQKDREAGRELLNTIKRTSGPVFIPNHGYLTALTGKNSYAHPAAMGEILGYYGGRETEVGAKLFAELRQALQETRFNLIILDSQAALKGIEEHYMEQGRVFDNQSVFWPISGRRVRPEFMYVPK